MKRYSPLALLRQSINATRPQMARYLGVSESTYEKAEVKGRSLSTAALIQLSTLQNAFEALGKAGGTPMGMLACKETVFKNFGSGIPGRLRKLRHEISLYSQKLRYMHDQWSAGFQQLSFMKNIKQSLPADDPAHGLLASNIAGLERSISIYAPGNQDALQRVINGMNEEVRGWEDILKYG